MNKRIKELAEQAEIRFKKLYIPDTTYVHESPAEVTKERLQKFAELIVKECADIALKSGSVTNKSAVAVAEADRIYHKINEHFGVK
jgi:hypothetical protein